MLYFEPYYQETWLRSRSCHICTIWRGDVHNVAIALSFHYNASYDCIATTRYAAFVTVNGNETGRIDRGLLLLIGVERNDSEMQSDRLLQRVLGYRVFADEQGKMNRSLSETQGGPVIGAHNSQLAADTRSGTRPGFSTAASPQEAARLFDYFVSKAACCTSTRCHGCIWHRHASDADQRWTRDILAASKRGVILLRVQLYLKNDIEIA